MLTVYPLCDSPAAGQVNGSKNFAFANILILPAAMRQAETAPKVQVVDASLQEGDLKVRINVEIHGTNLRIMDCSFDTNICGGIAQRTCNKFCQLMQLI